VPEGAPFAITLSAAVVGICALSLLGSATDLMWRGRDVIVLIAFIGIVFGQVAVVLMLVQTCRVEQPDVAYCRRCGYDLAGLTTGVCPECGTPTPGSVS
jgi:hypothetical protein